MEGRFLHSKGTSLFKINEETEGGRGRGSTYRLRRGGVGGRGLKFEQSTKNQGGGERFLVGVVRQEGTNPGEGLVRRKGYG